MDRIFVIIKPNTAKLYGDNIRTHVVGNGFEIVREKVVHFNEIIYQNLSLDCSGRNIDASVKYLASDQIITMIIEKVNGYEEIIDIVGHRDPKQARNQQPDSIRAIYGKDEIENAIEVSLNKDQYLQNKEIFFDDLIVSDSELKNGKKKNKSQKEKCLLIIKPHLKPEHLHAIKQMLINAEFEIMSERRAILPYDQFVDAFSNDEDQSIFHTICHEWSSGEITIFILSKVNAYRTIRILVGPDDPEIARSEAPSSIRARFGQDRIRNCCWYSSNIHQYNNKLEHFDFNLS